MELMRILGRESQLCSGSTGLHFCWESLDENHNLQPCMRKWWESPYENQNCEHWKNKTFRHSCQPKWNQRSTEGSFKKRIAKKRSETTVAPREASCQISSECFVMLCRPAWQAEKPQKVKFKHRCKKPHSLNCQPVKRESAQQQKTHFWRVAVFEK